MTKFIALPGGYQFATGDVLNFHVTFVIAAKNIVAVGTKGDL